MSKILFQIRSQVNRKTSFFLALSVAGIMLSVWCILSYTGTINILILPKPHSVIEAFIVLFMERNLCRHILWSFLRITGGYLLAIIVALPLGVMMGTFPAIKYAIHPFTGPLRYLPIAALIPLFIVWFGMDELMKILFLYVGIFVYILPEIINIVEDVDNIFLETAYTLRADRMQSILHVIIPAAMPQIFDVLRVMNGLGWTYVILAEILNAPYGLGHLITIAQKRSHTDQIFAGIIVILLIGYFSDRLIAWSNNYIFKWKEIVSK